MCRHLGGLCYRQKKRTSLVANLGLDTELEGFLHSTATLSQALISRENILVAEIQEHCDKFEAGLL
jgi:hypothetical protein